MSFEKRPYVRYLEGIGVEWIASASRSGLRADDQLFEQPRPRRAAQSPHDVDNARLPTPNDQGQAPEKCQRGHGQKPVDEIDIEHGLAGGISGIEGTDIDCCRVRLTAAPFDVMSAREPPFELIVRLGSRPLPTATRAIQTPALLGSRALLLLAIEYPRSPHAEPSLVAERPVRMANMARLQVSGTPLGILPLGLALLALSASCGKKPATLSFNGAITEITYRFGDASVPPEHHRSYSMTVTSNQIHKVTDSYGNVIEDKTQAIAEAQFQALVESLKSNQIGKVDETDSAGCTGGTTDTVKVVTDKGELFEGSLYHCGGEDFGDLGGNVAKFIADVKALWPNE